MTDLHERVLSWYDEHARDLPWRADDATPWGVMVSEFMLQQTPVSRVLPVYEQWMTTWPTPGDLAAAATGDAVEEASAVNPGGGEKTVSRWLIQHGCVSGVPARDVSVALARKAIFVSTGDFYATTLVAKLGFARDGLVRAGAACYTTAGEVERLVAGVERVARGA